MSLFFDAFSSSLASNVNAVLVMDKAGWHVTGRLKVPANVSLVHLQPCSRMNPVERVWLHVRERYLSHRVFAGVSAIIDACVRACSDFLADTATVTSLAAYLYLKQVETS